MLNRVIFASLMLGSLAGTTLYPQDIPDTPQGRMVQAYIQAFNSGNKEMLRAFFLNHVSREALSARPADERADRTLALFSQLQSLQLDRVYRAENERMDVAVTTGRGEKLFLLFAFESQPPHKLISLQIEDSPDADAGPPLSREEFLSQVNTYLDDQVRLDRFSGTVLIALGDSILHRRAYGFSDKRYQVPNRIETKYNLGSINKFFTQIAILQLVETKRLSLDDFIIEHLPEYPNKTVAGKVRIRHLLDMSSGLADFFGERYARTPKNEIRSLQDYLRLFVDDSLLFEPGSRNRYSNAGYIVLGLIIERATGMDYYTYVRRNIFEPSGMTNTDWYELDSPTPFLATGYTRSKEDDSHLVANIYTAPKRGSSAGGGYSTVEDLLIFTKALCDTKILGPRYSQFLLTRVLPEKEPAVPIQEGAIALAGGASGINSFLEFDAQTRRAIVVLSNYDPPSAMDVAKRLSRLMNRLKP